MTKRQLRQLYKGRIPKNLIYIFLPKQERKQNSHPICLLDRNEKERYTNLKRKDACRFAHFDWLSVLICEPPFESVPRCGSCSPFDVMLKQMIRAAS